MIGFSIPKQLESYVQTYQKSAHLRQVVVGYTRRKRSHGAISAAVAKHLGIPAVELRESQQILPRYVNARTSKFDFFGHCRRQIVAQLHIFEAYKRTVV